jgi:hypothetical protein
MSLGIEPSEPAAIQESIAAALNALDHAELQKVFEEAGATFWSRTGLQHLDLKPQAGNCPNVLEFASCVRRSIALKTKQPAIHFVCTLSILPPSIEATGSALLASMVTGCDPWRT